MTILVATDFSPCSRAAVRLAAAIARQRSSALVILNAVEEPPIDLTTIPVALSSWERDLVAAAESAMAGDAREAKEHGIRVETRVVLGNPIEAIREAMAADRPQLVVMGTHGRRGAARFFLGSVAEAVVRKAGCPVLVTGEGSSNLARWSGREPLRLAVATDGSPASRAALSWTRTFEASRPCDVSIVRLYSAAEAAARYGLDDPWAGRPRGPELVRLLERDLRRDAEQTLGRVPGLRLTAVSNDAGESLADEAALLGADGVVIGIPRGRPHRWDAIAPAAVLRAASVPVLCVPEAAVQARGELPRTTSILLPTDLSEASREAILPAYGLLREGGGHVELCTVHVLAPAKTPELPAGPPLDAREREGVEARLRALVPPEADAAGITTSVSVLEARSVPEAIVSAAERLGVDLVAVGSHGRSGFKRAVLGSVAEQVARTCPRPVLIVSERARRERA